MKILLGIYSRNDSILQISQSLIGMGHEVICWYADSYSNVSGYVQKKIYKMGYRDNYNKYRIKKREEIFYLLKSYNPDKLLFVNIPTEFFEELDIKNISSIVPIYIWCIDGVSNNVNTTVLYCKYAKKISLFEPDDVHILQEHGCSNAAYVPVGYNRSYEIKNLGLEKIYDISFIGTFYKKRLEYMNQVAKYAIENGLKLYVAGPLYEGRYFWKKIILGYKYPYLMKVAQNISLKSDAVAKIYSASKICINIHSNNNKGLNPRVFEVMATGSLLLTDVREKYYDLINPGIDCDVFANLETLLEKIDYYLHNVNNRQTLSRQGIINVANKLSMENSLSVVLDIKRIY